MREFPHENRYARDGEEQWGRRGGRFTEVACVGLPPSILGLYPPDDCRFRAELAIAIPGGWRNWDQENA
ncbi:MAG: hypothetical protein HC890_19940 [Chloroflexaceae bacterium]|nr:hypothetical protein [Chloroflexaceae bacterium]